MLRFFPFELRSKQAAAFRKMIQSGLAVVLFAASTQAQQEPLQIDFAFDVKVTLSPKAAARLKARHEGIIVSADYTAHTKPGAESHANQIGSIDLGREDVKIAGAQGLAHVTGAKVDRKRLDWATGPVLLNVNAYSARRSSPDNILACDIFDGELTSAVRTAPELHCSLIAEKAETQHKQ